MTVVAIEPNYQGENKDRAENFHGKQLLGIGWDQHLSFGPLCFPVSPETPFAELMTTIIPALYASHPDTAQIDWSKVQWLHANQPFIPDPARSLAENGIGHKSLIRFRTPGLSGYKGTGN